MSESSEAPQTRSFPKSVQPGIPRLAPPPNGWSVVPMRAILKPVQRPVQLADDETYQLVTARRNRGGIVAREKLKGRDILTKTQFRTHANDFLVSRRQIAHGACGIVPADLHGAVVSNEYATLVPSEGTCLEFIKHLSHSIYFQQTCFHSSIGVHVEKLVFDLVKWLNWRFVFPQVAEQRRIAAVLNAWDDAIAIAKHLTIARQRRQGKLLADLIDPYLEGMTPITHLCSRIDSGAWGEDETADGTQVLRNTDFTASGPMKLDAAPRRQLTSAERRKTLLARNDILLEKSGGGPDQPVGRVCRYEGDGTHGFSNFLMRLRAVPEVEPGFLFCVLQRRYEASAPLRFQQQTTGIRNLEWADYLDLGISVPLREQQKKITTMFATAEASVVASKELQARLRLQKRGLMQKLLTGAWRVPESAETLMPGGQLVAEAVA